jgi:hypothetical protein
LQAVSEVKDIVRGKVAQFGIQVDVGIKLGNGIFLNLLVDGVIGLVKAENAVAFGFQLFHRFIDGKIERSGQKTVLPRFSFTE